VCLCIGFWKQMVDNIAYAEFAYNNSYQSTIGMSPLEALYGRKCHSPLYKGRLGRDQSAFELLDSEETRQKVQQIKDRLLATQSR
jgi:hypothetical protein